MRRFVPLLATAVLLPCLIALGMWQLDRSRQKLEIRELVASRVDAPAIDLSQGSSAALANAGDVAFRAVSATGVYDVAGQVLIDNRIHQGQAGYHVLTPLRFNTQSHAVLVNRGWVPWGNDRTILPDTPAPDGAVTVSGRAIVPGEYFELEAPENVELAAVWQNLDLDRFARRVGYPLMPIVVELDETSDAGGFVRRWRDHDDGWVERHRGYAFQWFSLAATLVIINLVLWVRRRRQ